MLVLGLMMVVIRFGEQRVQTFGLFFFLSEVERKQICSFHSNEGRVEEICTVQYTALRR